MPPTTFKRRDLKPGEVLCSHCTALCCRYFALPIDTPTTWRDFENIRWYMLHGEISIFVDKAVWYLVVHADCRHLLPDQRCGIYEDRPSICRQYSTSGCEFDNNFVYDKLFEFPEQIMEYAEAVLPPPPPSRAAPVGFPAADSGANCMTSPLIKPETLKGFRDYLPAAAMAREQIMDTARRVYRAYGFSPIETPALEYSRILLGKGGEESDKQLFRFTDQGERDVSMRFDLTVPFARFAAQHLAELGTPFKRYHLGTVWRAEKPQKGRFREFMQCDFDTIGTDSNAADVETLLVIHDLFTALGFESFSVRINNRLVLNGLLEKLGLQDRAAGVLRALDKLHKAGRDAVISEMTERVGATPDQAARVLEFANLSGAPDEILTGLEPLLQGSGAGERGVCLLRELFQSARTAGIPAERVVLDLSIARGLDYYTGTIYETLLGDLPGIGSVCSGGRYDNLAGLFTSQRLPGVGASLGLDRLLAALEELGRLPSASTPAPVLVVLFQAERLGDYLRVARALRAAGINTEVYPEPKPVGKQLKYADRKGFRLAVIAGENEFASGQWQLKDLHSGGQELVADAELVEKVRTLLLS